jgi:photosystem II stability/assembly factor-like uncharacterized protein
LILLICVVSSAVSDWEVVRQSPSTMIMEVSFVDDGLHGMAVGYKTTGGLTVSTVLGTSDGGVNWEQLPFPASTRSLRGVHRLTPDSAWVVGTSGTIYATSDGGQTWTQQNSGTGRLLAGVHFVDHLTGWATGGWSDGSAYLVLHTTDGGANWASQSFGSGCYSCEAIFFFDDQTGWITGRDSSLDPHIHKTTDGGASWVRQTVPIGASNTGICDIEFADADIGWAATTGLNAGGPILYTDDGGSDWIVQESSGLHYHRLDVQDAFNVAVIAVKILSPSSEKLMITSDGGSSWQTYIPPITAYTYGLQYVSSSVWLGSDYTQILHSPDQGSSWEWQYRAPYWKSIGWLDANSGWAGSGTWVGDDSYAIRTDDGGSTWDPDTLAPGGAQVLCHDVDIAWMLWEGTQSQVWHTTDGGANWTGNPIVSGPWIGRIFFVTADSGWACGSSGALWATVDGGSSWSPQTAGTTMYVAAVCFVDHLEGWAGGGYGGGNGFIRHTVDGGENWIAQTPATSAHIQDMVFTDSEHGWACMVGGGIQGTSDGGASWQSIGSVPHVYADRIVMLDSQSGWVLARDHSDLGGRGFIYRTNDAGATWTQEWSGTMPTESLNDLVVDPSGDVAWASGYHDTILRCDGITGIEEDPEGSPDGGIVSICSVFPNPLADFAEIQVELSMGGPSEVSVYDLTGRCRATLWNGYLSEGAHSFSLTAFELPVGIYVVRARTSAGSDAQSFVIVR